MPDLDLMPPGHAVRPAPPPPAGHGDVHGRAVRRRRRQQVGVLATGAAACAAVLAVTVASGGAVESLGVTPAHPIDGQAPAVTAPGRGGGPDVVAPAAPAETPSTSTDTTRTDNATAGAPDAQAAAPASGTTSTAHRKAGSEVGPPHTTVAYDPSRGCAGAGPTATQGWCGYYDGALSGRSGQRVELAQTLCRLPGRAAGTLRVDTGEHAEFSVRTKDNYDVWDWAKGRRFSPRGATFTVAAGSCLRWSVSWNIVNDAGRPIAAGAYQLNARPTAYPSEATSPYVWADAQFTTFTVTS
jgi:hypothetical protein